MLALIAFIIKLIIGTVISYLLPSLLIKDISNEDHLSISFIGILSTSIFSVCLQLGGESAFILCIGGMVFLGFISYGLSDKMQKIQRLLFCALAVIGLFVGIGYILQGIILSFLVYYIIKNQSDLFLFLSHNDKNEDD